MNTKNNREKILTQLQTLEDKSTSLIHEAKQLIKEQTSLEEANTMFEILYKKYRKILLQKEFCNYCLMYNEVMDETEYDVK